ncbi:MAG TPA: transglutaminase domain-containing protein [Paludibacter sp.]|nr:transglutaminase domain-containing protein [Paludibacter sp.]
MKRMVLPLLILLPFNLMLGSDYNKVDSQLATVPATLRNASEITADLTRNLSTSTEKVRAIYYWISHNIRYDVSQLGSAGISYRSGERNLLNEVLQKRQGVCQHYAELFNACCKATGIQSYIISGYTKTDGKIAPLTHAWNAVVINGKYYEIDATWASGYVDNGKFTAKFDDTYFMIPPAEFIKTHMPFDPIWQFLDNPVSNKEFQSSDFSKLKIRSNFNFADSIKTIAGLDSLSILIRENKRIRNCGLTNDLIREYVSYNQQNIVQIKYNQAVGQFNKAIEAYNIYVMHKNKQFKGSSLEDAKIMELLSAANNHAESAQTRIRFLNGDNSTIMKNIFELQTQIEALKKNIDTETLFVKKYISTGKPFRMFLFGR